MKRIIVPILLMVLLALASATSQVPCVTETFSVPDLNGGCCNITVRYCYQLSGGVLLMSIDKITVPSDCQLIVNPGLFNWLYKKIIWRLNTIGIIPGGIPNCPATSIINVQTSQASCWMRTQMPTGINEYSPCGNTICTRRCAVCLSTSETDPCNANEPMLQYVGCQNTIIPCVPDPFYPDCLINTCDSN